MLNVNLYLDLIKEIEEKINSINSSITNAQSQQQYVLMPSYDKKVKKIKIKIINLTDSSSVLIIRTKGLEGIKFYNSNDDKIFEYCTQNYSSGDIQKRLSFLLVGPGKGVGSDYFADKAGIIAYSEYDAEDKCYCPTKITENYASFDKIVSTTATSFNFKDTLIDLSNDSMVDKHYNTEVNAGIISNDPIVNETLTDDKAKMIVDKYLKMYASLSSNNISSNVNSLIRNIATLMKNEFPNHSDKSNTDQPYDNR